MKSKESLQVNNKDTFNSDNNASSRRSKQKPMGEMGGFFNQVFALYSNKIIAIGSTRQYEEEDLFRLEDSRATDNQVKNVALPFFLEESKKTKKSLFSVAWRSIKSTWIPCVSCWVTYYMIQCILPFFLEQILKWLDDTDAPTYKGYILAGCIILLLLQKTILSGIANKFVIDAVVLTDTVFKGLVHHKLLVINPIAKKHFDNGKLTNIVTNDLFRIKLFVNTAHQLIILPMTLVIGTIFLYTMLNWIAFIMPIGALIGIYMNNLANTWIYKEFGVKYKLNDIRQKKTNEVVNGIKVIKFNAWEPLLFKDIQKIKKLEETSSIAIGNLRALTEVLINCVPLLISFICFWLYEKIYGDLSIVKVYSSLSFFHLLMAPMRIFMFATQMFTAARFSFARLEKILWCENLEELKDSPELSLGEIEVKDATFSWESKALNEYFEVENPDDFTKILYDISVNFKQGSKVAIVGKVGSGKSSLLQAIINCMVLEKGSVKKNGTIAYAAQDSFLMNATIKNNIIFGLPYNEEKYNNICKICCLEDDFKQLPAGDSTEIGERGINLSGGQKQRISVARSVYSNSDIYLLDDILSALDAYVGKKMWNDVIVDHLKEKTVILVTHSLHLLEYFDTVIIMKDGRKVCQGAYSEIKDTVYYSEVIADIKENEEENLKSQHKKSIESGNEFLPIDEFEGEMIKKPYNSQNTSKFLLSDGMKKMPYHSRILNKVPENKRNHSALSLTELINPVGGENIQKNNFQSDSRKESLSIEAKKNSMNINFESEGFSPGLRSHGVYFDDNIFQKEISSRKNSGHQNPVSKLEEPNEEKSDNEHNLEEKGLIYKQKEDKFSGLVKQGVYKTQFSAGGVYWNFINVFSFFAVISSRVFGDYWASEWGKDNNDSANKKHETYYYALIYLSIIFGYGFLVFLRSWGLGKQLCSGARVMHDNMIENVTKRPMSFFDTTPSGQIMNRASKDCDDLDLQQPFFVIIFGHIFFHYIGSVFTQALNLPYQLILVAVLIQFNFYWFRSFLRCGTGLRRLVQISTSPLLSLFYENWNGINTIRAFNKQEFRTKVYYETNEMYQESETHERYCSIWIVLRNEITLLCLVGITVLLAIINKTNNLGITDDNSTMGLTLTWVMSMGNFNIVLMFSMSEVVKMMSSAQRIKEYMDDKNFEKDFYTPKLPGSIDSSQWPNDAKVRVENLSIRYRENLSLVLNNISFETGKFEKVGIVGRTGSGKSTIILSLVRLIEKANKEGKIYIDDVDITNLGLHILRGSITIIPQDPILLLGTIRFNVDPIGRFTDNEIIISLKKSQVWDTLKNLEENELNSVNKSQDSNVEKTEKSRLDLMVDDRGENLSAGQRQLISLSRALILKTKIQLLDEATANIDQQTDAIIQEVIMNEFKASTIITIAHRLNTIIQYDKIIFLKFGEITEIGKPQDLLNDQNSEFGKLVRENGPEFTDQMFNLASSKA